MLTYFSNCYAIGRQVVKSSLNHTIFKQICSKCLKANYSQLAQKHCYPLTSSYIHTSSLLQYPLPQKEDPEHDKYLYSRWQRIRMKFGFLPISNTVLYKSSLTLHESCIDNVNYIDFFEVCDLPDTMYSWFMVTELHIWMCMVRLMSEGRHGRKIRNYMIESMWNDVEIRCKKLGEMTSSRKKSALNLLNDQFQAAIISYDEGLMGDDKVLAASLWRTFFSFSDPDPQVLECLIEYIRKQIAYLDSISQKQILYEGKIDWLPLVSKSKYR